MRQHLVKQREVVVLKKDEKVLRRAPRLPPPNDTLMPTLLAPLTDSSRSPGRVAFNLHTANEHRSVHSLEQREAGR